MPWIPGGMKKRYALDDDEDDELKSLDEIFENMEAREQALHVIVKWEIE